MTSPAAAPEPAAEPIEPSAPPPEASAAPSASDVKLERQASPEHATMNALLRGLLPPTDAASKSDAEDAAPESDGASAGPESGVKPSEGQGPSRRGAAAELERLRAEVARLEDELRAARPPDADPSEEARARARETEARYRRLAHKPESDPDWTHEDIQFLEREKQRRAVVPELTEHYRTVLEDDLRAHREAYEGWVSGFKAHVARDLASAAELPGVDLDAVKAAPTFADRDRLVYAAGRAGAEAEAARLRDEVADLKRELLGRGPRPLSGGRSAAGGAGYDENAIMNALLRGGRR